MALSTNGSEDQKKRDGFEKVHVDGGLSNKLKSARCKKQWLTRAVTDYRREEKFCAVARASQPTNLRCCSTQARKTKQPRYVSVLSKSTEDTLHDNNNSKPRARLARIQYLARFEFVAESFPSGEKAKGLRNARFRRPLRKLFDRAKSPQVQLQETRRELNLA